jgi:hypothetical protein
MNYKKKVWENVYQVIDSRSGMDKKVSKLGMSWAA